MADIELIIKIPEGLKNDFESEQWTALSCMEMKNALEKATPLPKGHGRLKDVDKLELSCMHSDVECFEDCSRCHDRMVILSDLEDAPTIIEGDKEQ